jgi:lipopolysaccharide export system protein LptA
MLVILQFIQAVYRNIIIVYIIFLSSLIGICNDKATHDLYINSDEAIFDRLKNSTNFTGEVILYFDDMILKTSNLKFIYKNIKNKRKLEKIIISSRLIAKRDTDQEILIANSAEYCADKGQLTLIGDVKLQRESRILSTEKLLYHTNFKKIN